jgi:pimeloyl-ACP methyl ester carboxylesterase
VTSPTIAHARLRDSDISVMRGGAGPRLVMLHGAYDGDGWLPYMDALAESFEVIVPRHPGFGGELPEWLDRIADLANGYLDFLQSEQLTEVHLVGAALGGWIAAEMASRSVQRLASLTLVAPYGVRVAGAAGIDLFASSDEQALRDSVHEPALAAALIAKYKDPSGEDAWLNTRVTLAKLTWQPRLHDPFLQKWLHRIDVPTQLIWGARDKVVPVAVGHEWQRLIPRARLHVLEHCGHLPTLEQPRAVADLVRTFVAERRIAA